MHLKKGQIDKRNGMARKYHLGHRDPIFLDQKILKQNINQYTVVHITVQFYLQISSRYSGSIFKSIYLRVYVLEFYLLISLAYSSSIFKHIQIFQEFYLQISSTIVVLPRRFPQTITVHLDQHFYWSSCIEEMIPNEAKLTQNIHSKRECIQRRNAYGSIFANIFTK